MKARLAASLLCGLLVSAGLCLSGMTDPSRVLGFLDVFGHWDPTLAIVMIGAIGTHAVLFRIITRRTSPVFAPRFSIPSRRDLDRNLFVGSALFGVGWGLSGYCPGPVLASLRAGGTSALVFVAGMLVGMAGYGLFQRERSTPTGPEAQT